MSPCQRSLDRVVSTSFLIRFRGLCWRHRSGVTVFMSRIESFHLVERWRQQFAGSNFPSHISIQPLPCPESPAAGQISNAPASLSSGRRAGQPIGWPCPVTRGKGDKQSYVDGKIWFVNLLINCLVHEESNSTVSENEYRKGILGLKQAMISICVPKVSRQCLQRLVYRKVLNANAMVVANEWYHINLSILHWS